ncbi:heme biosynthesis protein HemY [Pseudogemmobacter sonorensis]|uniref:heme biosynthesis protein HemY n=1 Tax=Pseudogemmobacter sonorensis TaxID=2989681 RepID=UPI00367BF6CD
MLWSLSKVVLFLAVVALLAFLGLHLSESGSDLRIWIFDQEFTLGPLMTIIAIAVLVGLVWLGLKLMGLLVACFHFLNGDETAVSRYFDRNRERRGYNALADGMIALASGEANLAMARAKTASKLLDRPELTTLLTAQAAEAAGDGKAATEAWKALLSDEQTRFVAVRGLLRQKLAEGDTEKALKLAERAFALKPRHAETQDILLKLQAGGGDWKGARNTLSEKLRSGELPRSLYRRRDALLALQEAKTVLDEGSSLEAREAAIEANKLSPDLIPAAAIAARALVEKGDRKSASRVLKKAWEAQPHPDLAAAFAAIEPEETPEARLKRFRLLLSRQPDHEESRLTEAELLLATEDFAGARKALGEIPDRHPTQRALALLAAIERGQGAPEPELRAILTRALNAPRGPQWCCDKCQAALEHWVPICPSCEGFDTLTWRDPDALHGAEPAGGTDLSPFILGNAADHARAIGKPEIEEAEIEETALPPQPAPIPAEPVPAAEPAPPPEPAAPDGQAKGVPTKAEPPPEFDEDLRPDEILRRAN